MTATTAKRPNARELGQQTDEEILWFRSFGWSNERIAKRLGVTIDCIQKHDRQRANA